MGGFSTTNKRGGAGSGGNVQTYNIAVGHASILAVGDPVRVTGTAAAGSGIQEVDIAPATTAFTGVIAGFDIKLAGENLTDANGLAASTAGSAKVIIEPLQTYECESDATLAVADIGLNVGINATAATKTGGLTSSNVTIDAATKAATATLPWNIVGLLKGKTSGVFGDRAVVVPNATTQNIGATGI